MMENNDPKDKPNLQVVQSDSDDQNGDSPKKEERQASNTVNKAYEDELHEMAEVHNPDDFPEEFEEISPQLLETIKKESSPQSENSAASQVVEPPSPEVTTNKKKFRIPIVVKLVTISVALILTAAISIALSSADNFSKSSQQRASDGTNDQANSRAIAVETQLGNIIANMRILSSIIAHGDPSEQEESLDLLFKKNDYFVSLEVIQRKENGKLATLQRLINNDYLSRFSLKEDYISRVRNQIEFPVEAIFSSTEENPVMEVRNASSESGIPLMTIGIPYATGESGEVTHITIADIRLDQFQKIFTASTTTIFAVDKEGTILAHPDDKLTVSRQSLIKSPIVKSALRSSQRQGASRFQNEKNEWQLGAFAKTSYGITIIAQASESIILEDARDIRHKSFGIAAMVLSGALFAIIIFAMTLTAPIERLEFVANQIAKGNFNIKTNVKSRDEVGQLAETIDEMVVGLVERDKAKTLINKFHGSSVAEDMMAGEIELKGERKDVTVFFSDIRDFTKFSEGHTPEEVVDMLNEYFGVMVKIINRTGGMVDKFIGDAIMAVWGTQTEGADEINAIQACLEMRMDLEKLNLSRLERGLNEIRIGVGLHSGTAISGTIGSDERMEYTVIGDTVNMAARIEASTKAFGTDLLVSETTESLVKEKYWSEIAGTVEVKGKSEPLKLFKIRGTIENGEKKEWKTAYSQYDAGKADKVKVA